MATHTIMMLKVRMIIPPPSTTITKKRVLPTSKSKGLLLDVKLNEVLVIVVLKKGDAVVVGTVAVVVVLHSSTISPSVPGTVQLNFAVGE